MFHTQNTLIKSYESTKNIYLVKLPFINWTAFPLTDFSHLHSIENSYKWENFAPNIPKFLQFYAKTFQLS